MLQEKQCRGAALTADTGDSKRPIKRSSVVAGEQPERKWRRSLREILARSLSTDPRHWLNRMLAEKVCGDHTLPSTVSELERTKGLSFERTEIEIIGYAGEPARVMAYRLAPESLERARELLGLAARQAA